MDSAPLLSLRGISKRFLNVTANDRVDLDVSRGEVLALVGENGAGKSTLMKILYGFYRADAGEIRLEGRPVNIRSPHDARRLGIGLVFQDFVQIPALTVAENIALFLPDLPWVLDRGAVAGRIQSDIGAVRLRGRSVGGGVAPVGGRAPEAALRREGRRQRRPVHRGLHPGQHAPRDRCRVQLVHCGRAVSQRGSRARWNAERSASRPSHDGGEPRGMSTPIASYAFLSWARQGLGMHTQDAPAGQVRGTVPIGVTIRGKRIAGGDATETFRKNVDLYGPGDIVGIDPRAIIRTDPRHWITDFEPNYLPFVEFYDEDFPWRYTPAAPSPDRSGCTPWLTLVVLEEGEFTEGGNVSDRPLPFIGRPTPPTKFPPRRRSCGPGRTSTSTARCRPADIERHRGPRPAPAADGPAPNRDQAFSRLDLSAQAQAEHAPITPSSSRPSRPGGWPGSASTRSRRRSATTSAWDGSGDAPEPDKFPVYYRWYFRTGRAATSSISSACSSRSRSIPGSGSATWTCKTPGRTAAASATRAGRHARLGGALRVPLETLTQEDTGGVREVRAVGRRRTRSRSRSAWRRSSTCPTHVRRTERRRTTDPADHAAASTGAGTRACTGCSRIRRRSLRSRELAARAESRPALPRRRRLRHHVVQKYQEDYMEAAWQQVGDVLAGNRRIRLRAAGAEPPARLVRADISSRSRRRGPSAYLDGRGARAPARASPSGLTVQHRMRRARCRLRRLEGDAPGAAPARAARATLGFERSEPADKLLARINTRRGRAAPPKTTPPGAAHRRQIADDAAADGVPWPFIELLRRQPVAALAAARRRDRASLLLLLAAGVLASWSRSSWSRGAACGSRVLGAGCTTRARPSDALRPEDQTRQQSTRCRTSPTSRIAEPGQRVPPDHRRPPTARTRALQGRRCANARGSTGASAAAPGAGASRSISRAITDDDRATSPPSRTATIPAWTLLARRDSRAHPRAELVERLRRGDGLSGDRHADVRAAQAISARTVPAQHQPDRAEQHHAARDEPEVHRGVHGRAQPRVRARAAVARVPDRSARQLLPPVLGRRASFLAAEADATTEELRERLRDIPALHTGRRRPSSATTITARRRATTKRSSCS